MAVQPIVVGTDGSATADRAVDKAGELAATLGAPLHVVMSYKIFAGSAPWPRERGGHRSSGRQ
jgi:nucleotide-binding universal stress UspA family protein